MTKIYKPFIDGILGYDCKECGYNCCKHGFILMNKRERNVILKENPHFKYFLLESNAKTSKIRKYSRCWFLSKDGLCRVQKKHGYSLKPLVCRLHPFYVSKCKDKHIIVTNICPTMFVKKKAPDGKNADRAIYKNALEYLCAKTEKKGRINWSHDRLRLEEKILADSRKFLNGKNYLDFAVHQIFLTGKSNMKKEIKTRLLQSIAGLKTILGIKNINFNNKKITYELTALTPLLRAAFNKIGKCKIPVILSALYIYMILFSKTTKNKIYASTYAQVLGDIALGLSNAQKDDFDLSSPFQKISPRQSFQRITPRASETSFGAITRFSYSIASIESLNRIDKWVSLGSEYERRGKYGRAAEVFKKATQMFPESEALYLELGRTYFKLGRYDEAIRATQRLTKSNYKKGNVFFSFGRLF